MPSGPQSVSSSTAAIVDALKVSRKCRWAHSATANSGAPRGRGKGVVESEAVEPGFGRNDPANGDVMAACAVGVNA